MASVTLKDLPEDLHGPLKPECRTLIDKPASQGDNCRMTPLLEVHRDEVAVVCRRLGVERLDVFGSAAREDFDPNRSDLDFLVRFAPPHDSGYADRYLELAEVLERVFQRRVDLLTERSLHNPILKQTIASDRLNLYGI